MTRSNAHPKNTMDIATQSHALIPRRLVVEAAHNKSTRVFGRLKAYVKEVQVTVSERPLKAGATCCQVEIDSPDGVSVVVRTTSTDPIDAVSQVFEKAARSFPR